MFFDLGAGLGKSRQDSASLGKSAVSTGASREAPVDNECFSIWQLGLGTVRYPRYPGDDGKS